MIRKILGLIIAMTALVCMGCASSTADPASDKAITLLAIPGVTAPVRGANPVTTAIDTAQYTGVITWSPADSPFAATTAYTANIVLTARAGWTFSGVAANSFAVAGATTTNAANSGMVAAVFPATGGPTDVDVVFSGVTQAGGAANAATTTSLTLNFSVDPASLTASNITVTGATAGTLTGSGTTRNLEISDITVADGATVSVSVTSPSGFAITGSPKTAVVYKAPITINLLEIPGLVSPVRGGTPVTTIDTAQYTGTITWSPAAGSFAASTEYTANIVLMAKTGWTLTGVAANGFTVAGAKAMNAINSGMVAAVFPVTLNFSLTMITVPAGSFQRDSGPLNISKISNAFRMSEKEITRAQFFSIMGTDPSRETFSNGTSDPVQLANWYHAIAFCNKLSIAEGLTRVYDVAGFPNDEAWTSLSFANIPLSDDAAWNAATVTWTNTGYRLPTEMEWMWAAMGATSDNRSGDIVGGVNTGGYTKGYAGSTEGAGGQVNIGNYAWYNVNSGSSTKPVGTTGTPANANELGLYDMSGNVFEWCWDRWDGSTDYAAGMLTDFRGTTSSTRRVLRGGSAGYASALYCTVAYRTSIDPYYREIHFGFRVVRR